MTAQLKLRPFKASKAVPFETRLNQSFLSE